MKFGKVVKVMLSCLLAGALFTGCGGGDKPVDKPDKPEPTPVKLGMISHLNANEKKMEEILDNVTDKTGVNVSKFVITYYDDLKLMQMGIESGSVEQISLYECVAKYLAATNSKYSVVANKGLPSLSDSFCFAVRKDDAALKADLDRVIGEMQSDGTLDKLIQTYITEVKPDNIPAVEIPHIDGAESIKVGITGDLPPLDLVLADNSPAGFNTAMLAEIAKRLNRNVEVVNIQSGARATALSSGQIDVVFWVVVPNGDNMPNDIDKPDSVELSKPYFKDAVNHLEFNK